VPRPDRPKTVTIPEIIDQIHELIWEDRRISAKSRPEQLDISSERVESTVPEVLDMRKFSAKCVPNCLNADKNVNGASCLSKFWNFSVRSKWFLVAMGDNVQNLFISLWPGDKATSSGVAARLLKPPPQKKFRVQKSQGKGLALIFFLGGEGSRRLPTHWIPSKGPNYQRGVLLISAGAI